MINQQMGRHCHQAKLISIPTLFIFDIGYGQKCWYESGNTLEIDGVLRLNLLQEPEPAKKTLSNTKTLEIFWSNNHAPLPHQGYLVQHLRARAPQGHYFANAAN